MHTMYTFFFILYRLYILFMTFLIKWLEQTNKLHESEIQLNNYLKEKNLKKVLTMTQGYLSLNVSIKLSHVYSI